MQKTVAVIKAATTSRVQTTMAAMCPDFSPPDPVSPSCLDVDSGTREDSDVIGLQSVTLELSPENDDVGDNSDVIRLELEDDDDDDVSETYDDFDAIWLELVAYLELSCEKDDVTGTCDDFDGVKLELAGLLELSSDSNDVSGMCVNSDVIRPELGLSAEDDDVIEVCDVIWLDLVMCSEPAERDESGMSEDRDVVAPPSGTEETSCCRAVVDKTAVVWSGTEEPDVVGRLEVVSLSPVAEVEALRSDDVVSSSVADVCSA